MNEDDLRTMLIDYMGRGFLDNIAALMKQDPSMVRFLPDLLGDDAIVVRLGATALVEELVKDHRQILGGAVAGLVALLGHENPTIRGDAANVLGIIRDRSAVEALMKLQNDGHASVREIAQEAQREIEAEHGPLLNNSGHGEGARDVT
jgi:HEAT repeat protein